MINTLPLLIKEHDLTIETPNMPFTLSGGCADLFVGHHRVSGKVAVKRLRLSEQMDNEDAVVKRFIREGTIWRGLNFIYIQPFLGVYYMDSRMCLVSPFEENGSLPGYLKRNPNADRQLLLFQTALAIAYLHKHGIIHSDVKGDNILISREQSALLGDLGLARFEANPTSEGLRGKGSVPWQSPELLNGESKSYESDMYAFGMTIYEALSGNHPLSHYDSLAAGITAVVIRDERPPKYPFNAANGKSYCWLWTVAERCWSTDPSSRLTALQVVGYLNPDYQVARVASYQLGGVSVRVTAVASVGAFFFR